MANLQDSNTSATRPDALARKTKKALASIERRKFLQERNGAMVGMSAGGFGRSASSGWLGAVIKFIPIVAAAGLTILAIYSLALSLA